MTLELYAKASGFSFLPCQFWASMPYLMAIFVLAVMSARARGGARGAGLPRQAVHSRRLRVLVRRRVEHDYDQPAQSHQGGGRRGAGRAVHQQRPRSATKPLKVGYIYLGPIGDYGWTWAHEKGRKEMVAALGGKVTADYVENVNEDAERDPRHPATSPSRATS